MKLNEYLILKRRAEDFYRTAIFQIESKMYDIAVFSLEQYLQLLIKAYLLKNGVDFPRIHGVRALLKLLIEIIEDKGSTLEKLLDNYELELSLLEDAYITSRYIPKEFTETEVYKVKEAVEAIAEEIKRTDP